MLPRKIRVSLGSAMSLGLLEGKSDAIPTTAYLMTYLGRKCSANCSFCPQARTSDSRQDMLSRVSWPVFDTTSVVESIANHAGYGLIRRVCIQALNYPEVFAHLCIIVGMVKQKVDVPISISCQPLSRRNLGLLAACGVDRIGIPLDAATESLFDKLKGTFVGGPYLWNAQFELLRYAVQVFGHGKASTHLIVGLGETEEEMVGVIQKCVDIGVLPALFAFTPIRGTRMQDKPPPKMKTYRRIQLARDLIVDRLSRSEKMSFDKKGRLVCFGVDEQILIKIAKSGKPFLTSGCPNCNRPYYNEKPTGPIYNYPISLTEKEIAQAVEDLIPCTWDEV